MMFRSLVISSSLLALLASGSVMAMEGEDNDVSSSLKSLKRNEEEMNLPQAMKKKKKNLC